MRASQRTHRYQPSDSDLRDGRLRIAPDPAGLAPVSPERVRERAYEIFLDRLRNGGRGDETSDWLQAERELLARAGRTGRAEQPTALPEPLDLRSRVRGDVLLHDAN